LRAALGFDVGWAVHHACALAKNVAAIAVRAELFDSAQHQLDRSHCVEVGGGE